eukprot:CAMPEP_0204310496 /NCGR_PEP_ID=MMETSP0469-20131031/1757_1 /ASSEMBLY_ACC=CAM_ASM_000384 /TAXON_ID=2969 /ORGANISM="Oxyrrhis marina" /LENGTH=231 /DNA_ID=CAMNT_0051290285 /DNA_START=71 /DNA_END=763 /DNA_ORIENTATION=-
MPSTEEISLAAGEARIKFECRRSPKLDSFDEETVSTQISGLSAALVVLEELGAAPIAPDGKLAGNAGAVCPQGIIVSRSGKPPGVVPAASDFCVVGSFDSEKWSCEYGRSSASDCAQPTSDAPLHWASLVRAPKEFGWERKPQYLLHGHALETEYEAQQLKIPISTQETLFSTKEDTDALMQLLQEFPYPANKIWIRKGHGFVILGSSIDDVTATLGCYKTHFSGCAHPAK